jgi:hypothetical protein
MAVRPLRRPDCGCHRERMRTNEPVRSLWGIAFNGFGVVFLLVALVATFLLAEKLWALDGVPVLVEVLLPLGAALMMIGGLCYMALGIRSQVDGVLPRPRHGVLTLGPSRLASISFVLACTGTWIFGVGLVIALVFVLDNDKTIRMGFWPIVVLLVFVLACPIVAWMGYVLLRMSRLRFVADGWGLRWGNPFWPSPIQLQWEGIERIELRGSRPLSMRMVVITNDGRSRLVWVVDPSIPVSTASYRTIFDEVVGLRP